MALIEKTIGAGGDYADIQAWVDACPGLGADIWKGVIITSGIWDEEVAMSASGTASSTSYLWLDVDPSIRHDGVAQSGAYLSKTGTMSEVALLTISTNWTRISHLEVYLGPDATSSKEGIRVVSDTLNVLIEDCLIWTDDTTSATDQDGIYLDGALGDQDISISNTVITGFNRGGVFYQNYTTDPTTAAINIDHCSIYANGTDSDGTNLLAEQDGSGTCTWNIYNTALTDADNGTKPGLSSTVAPSGALIWDGSHNLYETDPDVGTNNLTNKIAMTDGIIDTTQTVGAYWVVENSSTEPYDLRLLDDAAGNAAIDAGINRQGSEPDTRQDFSSDAKGEARPTTGVDIGAFEYQLGNVGVSGQKATTSVTITAGSIVIGGTNPPDTPVITTPTDGSTVTDPVQIVFTYNDPDDDPLARVAVRRTYTTIYP